MPFPQCSSSVSLQEMPYKQCSLCDSLPWGSNLKKTSTSELPVNRDMNYTTNRVQNTKSWRSSAGMLYSSSYEVFEAFTFLIHMILKQCIFFLLPNSWMLLIQRWNWCKQCIEYWALANRVNSGKNTVWFCNVSKK